MVIHDNPWYRLVDQQADFLVIDKAPGANLHRNQSQRSLLDVLKADFNGAPLYLVHRLDDVTSGLLLIARSADAAARLAKQFAERHVQKFYLALADGKPTKKQGSVIGDMEKSRNGSYRLSHSKHHPAITRFISASVASGRRLYLLKPETGKTHQLRVALKSLGAPILGDSRYRGVDADRCYLHAYGLCFEFEGTPYRYLCPPSVGVEFQTVAAAQALLDWQHPWELKWPGSIRRSEKVGM